MAQPVWVLSVDLQTKTATFQSGMAEAAKSAHSAFSSIGSSARASGEATAEGTHNVRASLGLFDSAIKGEHARAMTDLIRLFEDSRVVMALLPMAAVAGGFLLLGGAAIALFEKLHALKEEQEKLARSIADFGTAGQTAFNSLDEKILQAGVKADELRNDHLGALAKQLKIIDMQSLGDLAHSFEDLGKKAGLVLDQLKTSWYAFGIGAAGAKHALDDFTSQYSNLLAKGKGGDASSLLKGTAADAERVLAMQKQAKDNSGSGFFGGPKEGADISLAMQAELELKKSGVGYTEKEIAAQEVLVAALKDQEGIEQRTNDLKKQDSENAKRTTAGNMSAEHSSGAKQAAASMLQMGQQALDAEKAVASARLTVQRASIQARTANDLDFASREYQMQLAANTQQIKALDKYAKDYPNQLKEMHNKALEIEQEYATRVATITSKAQVEQSAKDLSDLEASERDKIDATQQGSAARLQAIDAALKEERSKNMQDLAVYKALQTERVNVARQMSETAKAQAEAAGKEASDNGMKMAALALAAAKEQMALRDSSRRVSDAQRVQEESQIANQEYALKLTALAQQTAALDKSGKDYENKLKALQNKQKQLIQQHEDEITAIQDKAAQSRNARILSADTKFRDSMSTGLTQVMMRYQSFGMMLTNVGNQVVSGMMKNAMQSVLADDYTKERDAARAARQAFNIGLSMGGPAGYILGPVMAAGAFAQQMAFAGGTDYVPGIGRGDTVPAMLTPGEGIVPGGVMDGLRHMARSGNMQSGPTINHHQHVTYHVNTIDGDGMKDVLDKHSDQLNQHFDNHVRKSNKK